MERFDKREMGHSFRGYNAVSEELPTTGLHGPSSEAIEQPLASAADVCEWVRQLALQVARWHEAGRWHGRIGADEQAGDRFGSSPLAEPGESVRLGDSSGDWDRLPPPLHRALPVELPCTISLARERLKQLAVSLDPCEIDIYALGTLLCRWLTGESAAAFIRSPRVRLLVPEELRPIVERALQPGAQSGYATAAAFAAALKEVRLTAASKDTTPSFILLANDADDTSAGPPRPEDAPDSSRAPSDSDAPLPFTRLGHYEIVARLGRGGMGEVYLAYERALDRRVAIKVLPADLARSDEFVRRFKAEATAAARLIHPNIIQIHFIGEDAGQHYFVMQYVAGESLAGLLARRGKLPVDETLAIVEQALSGLAAAHDQGMVHRDIKPGNILLDARHHRVLLADFGLVKSLESSVTGKTATGVIMGTVDYISPEQGRGQAVDGRSDLYSLGVLLYQMLSGRLPFQADNPTALVFQHVYETAPALSQVAPEVPSQLASIVEKLLAKSPADRHQSAGELLADVRAFRASESAAAPVVEPAFRPTTIVRLPVFDDDIPSLPAELRDIAPHDLWQRARDRALTLFRRHAPEALQKLQNTQQQVEGAVAICERRERHLKQVAQEAESVLVELRRQMSAERAAGKAAGQRALTAEKSAAEGRAREEQRQCENAAAELEKLIAEQEEQLAAIQLRLAQMNARGQELRNRRDILGARLKAAVAQQHLAGGRRPLSPRRTGDLAWRIVAVALVGPAVFAVAWYFRTGGRTADDAAKHLPIESHSSRRATDSALTIGKSADAQRLVAPLSGVRTPMSLESDVTEKHLALSRDGSLLVVATHLPENRPSLEGAAPKAIDDIKLWDLTTGTEKVSFEEAHHVAQMAVSPDGNTLFSVRKSTGREPGEYRIWDLNTGHLKHRNDAGVPRHRPTAGFSPDSRSAYLLLGATLTQELGIVDVESGRMETMPMPQTEDQATSAAFSPVSDVAAIGIVVTRAGGRCAIDIHDPRRRIMLNQFPPGNNIHELQFSGDGELLAGSAFGTITAWETTNWTKVASFPDAQVHHERVAVSHDGRFIAGLLQGKVKIFDVRGDKASRLNAPFTCLDIAFHPGGTLIVAPIDSRVAFFDPSTGREQFNPKLTTQ